MVFPWQGALLFVGLTGLPHPDVLHHWATKVMSASQINLPSSQITLASSADASHQLDAHELHQELGNEENDMYIDLRNSIMQYLWQLLIFILVFTIANVVAVCLYKDKVHDKKPPLGDDLKTMKSGEFHFKLFDCFSNHNECMCSFFCPTVRYADTHSSVIHGGFWGSFVAFFIINTMIAFVGEYFTFAVMPWFPENCWKMGSLMQQLLRGLAFGILGRKKLREALGDPKPEKALVHDFLSWAFCSCCALTQESVEADIAADVTIACPFTLTKGRVRAREVAPSDHKNLLGEALLIEGGR